MVPVNFQKQSGVLPDVLKVRFERLVPLSQDVHVATFDTTQSSVAGRQRGLQVRSTRLGAERGSTAQLDIPIDCGMTLQVDFGCGADAPPGAAYDGGSYNSHVVGRRECPQAPAGTVQPGAVPTPAPTPTPTPTPSPEPTVAPAAPLACPEVNLSVTDLGSQAGLARLEIRTARPSARQIVVIATPEEAGDVLQTTVPPAGGTATLTAPAPQRWYNITVSAFADEGRCDVKLRICF